MRKLLVCVGCSPLLAIVGAPRRRTPILRWWDYLEQMSGPGPFDKRGPLGIFTIDTAVACRLAESPTGDPAGRRLAVDFPEQRGLRCSIRREEAPRRVQDFFAVRLGATSTDDERPLFQDRPEELQGKVTAWTIDVRFKRRLDAAIVAGGRRRHHLLHRRHDRSPDRAPDGDTRSASSSRRSVSCTGRARRSTTVCWDCGSSRWRSSAGSRRRISTGPRRRHFKSDNIDLIRRFSITRRYLPVCVSPIALTGQVPGSAHRSCPVDARAPRAWAFTHSRHASQRPAHTCAASASTN